MTSTEATRVLKVVEDTPRDSEDWSDLSALKRLYSEERVFGSHRFQWEAYQAASAQIGKSPTKSTCQSESSQFQNDPRVKAYIRELHRQRVEALVDTKVTDREAADTAKLLIHANNIGAIVLTATRLASCIYSVNRYYGAPSQTLDLNVANQQKAVGALKIFASRVKEEQRRKAKEA